VSAPGSDKTPLSPESRALDQVVRESRSSLEPPELDWSKLEARLMDRVAAEPSSRTRLARDVHAPRREGRVLRLGAVALAAAAALAIVVRKDRDAPLLDAAVTALADNVAGSLRATEGAGEVRVAGLFASAGQVLRAGDTIEADGARAVLERPRRVVWLLEKESGIARARVKSAGESLVVGLEDGAIEAQVTAVPSGEAFAVDVAAGAKLVRIAVHGTHLRVSRTASRVVVELSEGVVSIGAPPRTGSTYGTLVTAPAHVEFDATDLAGTLRVDHTPTAVRAPVPLPHHEHVPSAPKEPPAAQATPRSLPTQPAPAAAAPLPRPTAEPAVTATPQPGDGKPRLAPREAIAIAVRDCASGRSRPGDVRVTVTSSLKLQVGAGGVVESAQFVPPLLPEIQSCAAPAIYRAKLEEPGLVTIPIEFSY
jgi:ferric-dicitrate binding protein FerR (iron transport regulator)